MLEVMPDIAAAKIEQILRTAKRFGDYLWFIEQWILNPTIRLFNFKIRKESKIRAAWNLLQQITDSQRYNQSHNVILGFNGTVIVDYNDILSLLSQRWSPSIQAHKRPKCFLKTLGHFFDCFLSKYTWIFKTRLSGCQNADIQRIRQPFSRLSGCQEVVRKSISLANPFSRTVNKLSD